MGKLKEGASYIYERDNGTVYAREVGADPLTRKVIGMDYPVTDSVNWHDVQVVAKTNPTLQQALDRAIMLYKLSKERVE
jgi:outer membrane biogenesis lipoprotein LolB